MRLRFLSYLFLCLSVCPNYSYAGVTVIDALSFGSFIVKNNDSQYDIIVHPGGVYDYDHDGFILISPPQDGVYDIDGLTPNATIASVVITQLSPLSNSGENFQMHSFEEFHTNTNGSGVARITVGGSARTSGSGNPYLDQTYSGTLQIQINF